MKYEVSKQVSVEFYTGKYLKAMEDNEEKACFIGALGKYRIHDGIMSQLTTLTDMNYLLKSCIYPLYLKGDKEIGNRIRNIMIEILEGEEPDEIFQVICFIQSQELILRSYEEVPLVIKVDDIVRMALKRIDELSDKLKNYRESEASRCDENMYAELQSIIRHTKSFQDELH